MKLIKRKRQSAEVQKTLLMIDKELRDCGSLPELDFKAGYIAGRIYEREAVGLITPGLKAELITMLYTKYEVIRNAECKKEEKGRLARLCNMKRLKFNSIWCFR